MKRLIRIGAYFRPSVGTLGPIAQHDVSTAGLSVLVALWARARARLGRSGSDDVRLGMRRLRLSA